MNMPDPVSASPELPEIDRPLLAPRRVGYGRGARWVHGGFALFNRGMAVSVAVCLLSLVVSVLCNRTMISSVLLMLLSMVFSAGNMALAHRAQIQQRMRFDDWLAGFRLRLWPLVLTQLLFTLLMAGVVLLAVLVTWVLPGGHMPADAMGFHWSWLVLLMVVLAILVPLFMAGLFAAPLVFFHGLSALAALRCSLQGCWRNAWPLTWWSLIIMLLVLVGVLLLGVGLLVVIPVSSYSLYLAYRDIFLHDDGSGVAPESADTGVFHG